MMSEWYRENQLADLTLRIANAEKFGRVILAKKLREKLNEIKSLQSKTEEVETEKELLNE